MPRGGAKRRTAENLPAVSRQYIQRLIEKAEDPCLKALVATLYLSGRRISELVGRIYTYSNGRPPDIWEGIKKGDCIYAEVEDMPVLRIRCRILKRGRGKKRENEEAAPGLVQVYAFIDIDREDPFTQYITQWVDSLPNFEGKVFDFGINSRQKAWRLLCKLDPNIWVHWFRHQRLTHLSEVMDIFDLKEFGKFARLETALHYIHRAPGRLLSKVREADLRWGRKPS